MPKNRIIPKVIVDKSYHWCFFYHASQGEPALGGAWGIIFSSDDVGIKFAAGLGQCSNKRAELLALKMVLQLSLSKNLTRQQVFGDSEIVINWMQLNKPPKKFLLRLLFEEVQRYAGLFQKISFCHVF